MVAFGRICVSLGKHLDDPVEFEDSKNLQLKFVSLMICTPVIGERSGKKSRTKSS